MSVDFRIIDFNYPFQSTVTITGTSEDSNFPASNLGEEFRSRAWRSSGTYVIDSSNNKIDFKETGGGGEITSTLTSGTYTADELATEIKTQMDADTLNARTYTVTYNSSTGKFTITGSVYLDILFSTGTNASSSCRDVIGFGTADFTGATTYTGPNISIHTEEGVVFDLSTTEAIDTFAILFDKDLGVKLSSSAVVKLQANATDSWSSPSVEETLTLDEAHQIYTHFFTTDQSYRYWRISVVDTANANLYVELGTVILGKKSSLTRVPDNGFRYNVDDLSDIQANEFGNEYVDEFPLRKEIIFSMNILSYANVQLLETVYRRVGNKIPVFVALDTAEDLFDKDNFSIYGRVQGRIEFNHIIKDWFKTKFRVRETM